MRMEALQKESLSEDAFRLVQEEMFLNQRVLRALMNNQVHELEEKIRTLQSQLRTERSVQRDFLSHHLTLLDSLRRLSSIDTSQENLVSTVHSALFIRKSKKGTREIGIGLKLDLSALFQYNLFLLLLLLLLLSFFLSFHVPFSPQALPIQAFVEESYEKVKQLQQLLIETE